MKKFEAEIYNSDDKEFRIKEIADYFKVIQLLEALQSEVGDEGLVVWVPNE